MQNFRNLQIWQKSHELNLLVYALTSEFPKTERFGLTSQMRRAATSIPSNIAEGAGRFWPADFRRFIGIAAGSASELEYQLQLATELGFISSSARAASLVVEVKRILYAFSESLVPEN